ncbi:unnamed protein product [Musa textilis]
MPSSLPLSPFLLFFFFFASPTDAVFSSLLAAAGDGPRFTEAPHFRNGVHCPSISAGAGRAAACDPSYVHIAMTLDAHYLRGSIAAVHSILKHSSCPDTLFFHFFAPAGGRVGGDDLSRLLGSTVRSVFPALRFEVYPFRAELVSGLISSSVRVALQNPLNYVRAYLADVIDSCVQRVVYLDSDVIVVDDVRRLWDDAAARLDSAAAVVAAPEYCHANFTATSRPPFGRKAARRPSPGGVTGPATSTPG